jgi:anti-anti-sigma factor
VGDLEGEDALTLADVAETGERAWRRVVDLTEMTFIDSLGLRALVQLATTTWDAGGDVVLVLEEGSYVRRLLQIRGLDGQFRVVLTRAEALAD